MTALSLPEAPAWRPLYRIGGVSGFLVVLFGVPALYALYGPLLWVWFALVGISLLQLSRGIVSGARSFNRRHLQASREQRTA